MCRNATWRSEAFHVSNKDVVEGCSVLVYMLEGAVRQRSNDNWLCLHIPSSAIGTL